ncbi:MAG: hypothetical protein JOY61_05960 [Chloroflexi bacterium]|nr:hypothetical protein [Chloroflexota bacterium]
MPTSHIPRPASSALPRRSASLLYPVALTLVVIASYVRFSNAGFAGTDSLPLIETSRVLSWSDLLQQLRQPVMAGTLFTSGELIYRPVVSLTFALDYLIWGLDAVGYHITNLIFHLVTTLAVFGILRGLSLAAWSSFLGAAVFALHPIVAAAVPVIARRDNLVSAAPFCLALVCVMRAQGRAAPLWTAAAVVLFALALLSKEMAFGAAPLVPLVAFGAVAIRSDSRRALATGVRVALLFGLTTVAIFGLRFAVLGALGGYSGTGAISQPNGELYRHILVTFARFLFWPFRDVFPAGSIGWLVAPAALLALLLVASTRFPKRIGIPVAIGCLWLAEFALFYAALKTFTGAWYLYFALPGAAMLVAVLLEWSVGVLGSGVRSRAGLPAALSLGGTSVFAAAVLVTSPLIQPYDAWLVDGAASARYLGAVLDCARAAPDGSVLTFARVPDYLDYADNMQTELLTPTLVFEHTLTSFFRLALPGRPLQVVVEGYNHIRSPDHLAVSCDQTPNGRAITASS